MNWPLPPSGHLEKRVKLLAHCVWNSTQPEHLKPERTDQVPDLNEFEVNSKGRKAVQMIINMAMAKQFFRSGAVRW